jgi:hypothetical protein
LAFGVRLFEAAGEPRQFMEIAGSHNMGFLFSAQQYKAAWIQWLETLADRRPERPASGLPRLLKVPLPTP